MMRFQIGRTTAWCAFALVFCLACMAQSQQPAARPAENQDAADGRTAPGQAPDPAAEAVAVRPVRAERPEQQITDHDRSPAFDPTKPAPINKALAEQPKDGRIT